MVEAVFDDGSRLAVVSDPIGGGLGEHAPGALLPGPEHADPEPVVRLRVTNTATVPVSVTSHFHFFEANPRLDFDRERAPTACGSPYPPAPRSASGRVESEEVGLVPIGGERIAIGFAGLVDGPLDAPGAKEEALRRPPRAATSE
ncbi:urease subunit beta [Streptomyces tricolor]|nr:urease subunit beta [Streptomyces tricolor]